MHNDDELIAWFGNRELPEGAYRVSPWEMTNNLTRMVKLAIDNVRRGNPTARNVLMRLQTKLTEELKTEAA